MVDREARRYCKEAKDKTFRNPNTVRPLHPAASAAAERKCAASDAGEITVNNPLFEETEARSTNERKLTQKLKAASAAASETGSTINGASSSGKERDPASNGPLPFPPVRLRMDIADFSLAALMDYINGTGALRMYISALQARSRLSILLICLNRACLYLILAQSSTLRCADPIFPPFSILCSLMVAAFAFQARLRSTDQKGQQKLAKGHGKTLESKEGPQKTGRRWKSHHEK